ncbi:TadE/TadG family type IV pilus assembly protein [Marinovum sp.]|uniref:TadE/TadG family type IV pilus assembly protein n=1 Tax=Marinovum sp. TaxID=2024839 RepID=UPI002B265E93|nr:TadE/TadG family type IV pilus assembly protein [Marinovum sp.]
MQYTSYLQRFKSDETGSYSVEAALWLPIFTLIIALTIDVSSMYHKQSQISLAVNEANRAYATGRYLSLPEVETHVRSEMGLSAANAAITTSREGEYVLTQVSVPSKDLMTMKFFDAFNPVDVAVAYRQLVEW